MENDLKLSKITISFCLSLAICSVVNAALVIIKEKNAAVMTLMQKATGHHWITHSAIMLVLFFLLGGLLMFIPNVRKRSLGKNQLLGIMLTGIAIGCFAIAGFYLLAD